MTTKNLELVPHDPAHIRAMIAGMDVYHERFGVRPAEGLRDFIVSDEVSPDYLARLEAATERDSWTHGFAVILTASQLVIGMGGFKGPPDADGMVEIAYGIVPAYQGKGYATETANALVSYAVASGQVRRVRAHTMPEPNASTRVLTKCGFTKAGEAVDPDDGLVWRWEKKSDAG